MSSTGSGDHAASTQGRASFGQRLGASLLDGVILFVAIAILGVLGRALGSAGAVLAGLAALAVLVGYSIYFEGGPTGQTPGKKALGIRVQDVNGADDIGYGRAAARYFGKIVSGIPCYLGYLWMLWDPNNQAWHDKMASTVVVPV